MLQTVINKDIFTPMKSSKPLQCTLHSEERKQFERVLRLQGSDRMADRMAIVESFLSEEGHFTAAEWQELFKARGGNLAGDFVEKTLDLMATLGFCDRVEFEGSPPRYEHRHLGEHLSTIDRYTATFALRARLAGRRASLWDVVFRPPLHFAKAILLRAGFLDGVRGWCVAWLGAVYVLLKWSRLYLSAEADPT